MVERQPLGDGVGDLDKHRKPTDRITCCGRWDRLPAGQRRQRARRRGIKARLLNGFRALRQAAPPLVRARCTDGNCYHWLPSATSRAIVPYCSAGHGVRQRVNIEVTIIERNRWSLKRSSSRDRLLSSARRKSRRSNEG